LCRSCSRLYVAAFAMSLENSDARDAAAGTFINFQLVADVMI
jgi:hypothetical protein